MKKSEFIKYIKEHGNTYTRKELNELGLVYRPVSISEIHEHLEDKLLGTWEDEDGEPVIRETLSGMGINTTGCKVLDDLSDYVIREILNDNSDYDDEPPKNIPFYSRLYRKTPII